MTTNTLTSVFEQVQRRNPTWNDSQVIRDICETLLDEAEAEPPVNVEILASLCGIAQIERKATQTSGMLVCRDGLWTAIINGTEVVERQRFTFLHEAGHTLQPGFLRGREFHRCAGIRDREERLCDAAAAGLLLPRRFFVADLADLRGLTDVQELACAYEASVEATVRRVVDLSTKPQAMLVFQVTRKPRDLKEIQMPEPTLRLSYAHCSVRLPYPIRYKSVPDGCPIGRAWGQEINEPMSLDPYFSDPVGKAVVSAQRFGDRVLALAELASDCSQ